MGNFKYMSVDASTFLSLLSVVVAIATALAAHHYFKRTERQRDEEIIHNALTKLARYRADATTLKRERGKTGCSIDEGEQSLFDQLDLLTNIAEDLEKELVEILSTGRKITSETRSATLKLVALIESFSIQLQLLSAKFQNFNNNRFGRLVELQEQLPKLEALLRERLRKP